MLQRLLPVLVLTLAGVPAARAAEPSAWDEIGTAVRAAIDRKELPGAVVLVMHQGRVVHKMAYGNRSVIAGQEAVPMTTDTVFDLASLTKPVATATSVMLLIERGKLKLTDPVAKHWPEFAANGKDKVTVAHCLLHTSGLTADNALADYLDGKETALERVAALKLEAEPGARFRYSDVGFIVLGALVERLSGQPLDEFARANVFEPLGMTDTGFRPPERLRGRVAPTTREDGQWLAGVVHDPRSRKMGCVAGHAGLFGTADDLAAYARMLLGGGQPVLAPESVKLLTTARTVPAGRRTCGFDVDTSFSANRGALFSRTGGFGHTGFTGTSLWVDPPSQTVVVFLSNRVHPDEKKGNVTRLRGQVATIAARAVGVAPAAGQVLTGIDVLARDNFAPLKGKRVGLVTNHSGRDRQGRATIDLLHKAEGVTLVALFSPEHGIRGAADEKVADGKDEKTGLPVYSLYGERRKPTPEQLTGIDVLVYDIQDAGCRFYTYISTLGLVMEAAAAGKVKMLVLDRPNPIGGVAVAGPVLDAGRESFVAWHALPVRHGLTVGELARMFNQERGIGCDLEVIKMTGWRRADLFDRTGLTWVNPSPNLRSLTQALVYPGIGLLETTNLSVGRGTDQPFEWFGAPWLDGAKLAAALTAKDVPGVRWVPVARTPASSVFAKKECGGVQLIVDDWSKYEPLRTGLTVATELRRLYPDAWQIDRYDRLLGHKTTLEAVKAGRAVTEIEQSWQADLERFRQRRQAFLLYE